MVTCFPRFASGINTHPLVRKRFSGGNYYNAHKNDIVLLTRKKVNLFLPGILFFLFRLTKNKEILHFIPSILIILLRQVHTTLGIYSIIPVTRTPDNSNSPYLELKLNPLALILLHNLPPITRTFVNSNHFHRSLGGSSYREYTVFTFRRRISCSESPTLLQIIVKITLLLIYFELPAVIF